MRLFASEYWKCAETACVSGKSSSLKFVFAESLVDDNEKSTDQIKTFITKHRHQSGIQHVGFLCAKDIKESVRMAKDNGAQFLIPCSDYYLKVKILRKAIVRSKKGISSRKIMERQLNLLVKM